MPKFTQIEEIIGPARVDAHNKLMELFGACEENTELFHYTSLHNFRSMMHRNDNKLYLNQLWLSNYQTFRDIAEGLYGSEMLERNKNRLNYNNQVNILSNVYISCFSESPDDLGQWVKYADDGRGVMIGIPIEELRKMAENIAFQFNCFCYLAKVVYVKKDSIEEDEFRNKVAKYLEYAEGASGLYGNDIKAVVFRAYESMLDHTISLLIKHPAYEHEKEVRLVCMSRFGASFPKELRVARDRLVPYTYFDASNLPLSSLVFGPLTHVFDQDALTIANYIPTCVVTRSQIPYGR